MGRVSDDSATFGNIEDAQRVAAGHFAGRPALGKRRVTYRCALLLDHFSLVLLSLASSNSPAVGQRTLSGQASAVTSSSKLTGNISALVALKEDAGTRPELATVLSAP